jgi:transcription-repair coupling factor (superfamily II helicase)
MRPRELEDVMLRFIRGEADVLVCTTIIESGIDIPTANTMFIAEADHFGLAELASVARSGGAAQAPGVLLPAVADHAHA